MLNNRVTMIMQTLSAIYHLKNPTNQTKILKKPEEFCEADTAIHCMLSDQQGCHYVHHIHTASYIYILLID